jgi:hypothetical protein
MFVITKNIMKRPVFLTFSGEISKYALKKEPNIIVYHTFGSQIREDEMGSYLIAT